MPARLPFLLAVPVAVLLLAGCVPTTDAPTPGPSSSGSPSASSSPSPSASPSAGESSTPAPNDGATSEPVTIGCNDLISPDEMYSFNSQFLLLDSFTPSSGSLAAQARGDDGIACRWVNATSGETIDISVAHLLGPALADRKTQAAANAESVSVYDAEGYFALDGDVGAAQAFAGPYWIAAVSVAFFEARDATALIDYAVKNVG